jgi:hypothetical protein
MVAATGRVISINEAVVVTPAYSRGLEPWPMTRIDAGDSYSEGILRLVELERG